MNPLESIELRLKDLLAKRDDIDREVIGLQEARKILVPIYGQPLEPIPSIEQFIEAADVGITDAVRGAFRLNSSRKLTATQVRDIVMSHSFDLSKYTNAMAAIHQVIQRLIKAEQVAPFTQGDEKMFQWIEKPAPAPKSFRNTLAKQFAEGSGFTLKDITGGNTIQSSEAVKRFMEGPKLNKLIDPRKK